ncbi:sensor histidine kinase [Actinomycetota bacterium]
MTDTPPGRRGIPARWRIVAWILALMALALTAVIIAVRGVLLASVAEGANSDVAQELREFRQFAEEGRDPETAQRFTSTRRMLEVYLSRQHPGDHELIAGTLATGEQLEVRGAAAPEPAAYQIGADHELLEATRTRASGVHQTPFGEMRWGRVLLSEPENAAGVLTVAFFAETERQRVDDTIRILTFVSLGALAASGLMGYLVAGRILAPVRLVRQTAAEISDRDLTRRISVEGNDDVADLARTFNAMLDRLEAAFTAGQRFVDDAGHELRTPITVIRGHLELMGDDPEEQRQTRELVTQELDRMSRIVTDLLALAKVDRPDFVTTGEPVDVAELTMDLEAKASTMGDRRWGMTHVAEGTAQLDAQRVTQAVLQLAQNAVQHTLPSDRIDISSRFVTEAGEPMVEFSVADTGAGIDLRDQRRIFERFVHLDGTNRDHAGAGLGLSIVRAIAEAHGGRVWVDSARGKGATFTVRLPVGTGGPDENIQPDPGDDQ